MKPMLQKSMPTKSVSSQQSKPQKMPSPAFTERPDVKYKIDKQNQTRERLDITKLPTKLKVDKQSKILDTKALTQALTKNLQTQKTYQKYRPPQRRLRKDSMGALRKLGII